MTSARYSEWDGSQEPFEDLVDPQRLADGFTDRLLQGQSADEALQRMLQQGIPGRFGGLQSLQNRLRRIREERSRRSRLDDTLGDVERELDEILQLEREALDASDAPDAGFQRAMLDTLPRDPAGRVSALKSHEFSSPDAGARFEALLERLRQDLLGAHLDRIAEGMRAMTPDDIDALKDMIADLNRLLEKRRAGDGPSAAEFGEFMAKHGRFFPENPADLDELLEAMSNRAAAMSRLLASLEPHQRAQLEALSREILGDMDLEFEIDRLMANLQDLTPGAGWGRPVGMSGEQPLGLGEALAEIEQIAEFEQLEACLRQDYPGADLSDVDPEQVERLLGTDAARDLQALREIERRLEDAGMVGRNRGQLELTPRGVRRLGERALATVFERLRLDRAGSHEIAATGGFGEPTGSTRPWRFGDTFRIDIQRTVHNAVVREGASPGPIRLLPDDFELAEAETRTTTATVVLLDMSRSMPLRGHWTYARQMVFALHALITSQFPEDRLSIVGFSDYARVLNPRDLAAVDWEPVYGTNMEHAFLLAGRLLAKERTENQQIILVTDGEPTAHLVGDEVFFHWPPVRETLDRTFREATRLARSGVTMNIFMLEESPGLAGFIDRLARLVGGRVFSVADDRLGEFVVRDYVARRQRG